MRNAQLILSIINEKVTLDRFSDATGKIVVDGHNNILYLYVICFVLFKINFLLNYSVFEKLQHSYPSYILLIVQGNKGHLPVIITSTVGSILKVI